jgi:hypothetical protein
MAYKRTSRQRGGSEKPMVVRHAAQGKLPGRLPLGYSGATEDLKNNTPISAEIADRIAATPKAR